MAPWTKPALSHFTVFQAFPSQPQFHARPWNRYACWRAPEGPHPKLPLQDVLSPAAWHRPPSHLGIRETVAVVGHSSLLLLPVVSWASFPAWQPQEIETACELCPWNCKICSVTCNGARKNVSPKIQRRGLHQKKKPSKAKDNLELGIQFSLESLIFYPCCNSCSDLLPCHPGPRWTSTHPDALKSLAWDPMEKHGARTSALQQMAPA